MLFHRLCALALSATLLTACGAKHQAAEPTPTTEPAAPSSAPAPATTAPTSEPAEKSAPPTRSVRLNEDGSETYEENTGDTGAHNPLLAAVASTAAAATTPASPFKEGTNYTRLVPGQPTSAGPDQVEVLEVFWYGCAHCNAIEPIVEAWLKKKPAYVKFVRVPVMWDNDVHRSHARLFYTLQDLGKLDELHPLVFKEIHVNNNMLVSQNPAESEAKQLEFVKRFGVTDEQFKKAYHSFNVETNLQRAEQITLRYGVTAVPTFIVNGKYVTDVGMAGGADKIMPLIDTLAAQEHKH
ncbi:MAG: thiol:disulfide interchange protein DsbA/DsbL [Proteobacteria bacterium]|nr:thiol:disulfide interchange protein DsbA/DsbL [Pseudomonadota bacterium]